MRLLHFVAATTVAVRMGGAAVAACDVPAPTADERAAEADLKAFAGTAGVEFVAVTLERGGNALPPKAITALDAKQSEEAFVLAGARNGNGGIRVFLVGKSPLAVRYAATAFLEDYCGVRFFHAGPGGTVVPGKVRCTATEDLFDVREPCVGYRRLMHRRESLEADTSLEDFTRWMVRRSYQVKPAEGHLGEAFDKAVPLSLFDAHPEYFPEIDGRRSLEAAKRSRRRCFTNPDVQRLVADYIVGHCRHDNAFLLSQECVFGDWCQCAGCMKAGTGEDGHWRVQNHVHRFQDAVSRLVLERFPSAKITAQAYRDWRFPPTAADLVYDPRVAADYCPICRCYAHPLSASCNDHFRRQYEAWGRHAPRLGTFSWAGVSGMRYMPIVRVFAADFPWLLDHGFDAWLKACSGPRGRLAQNLAGWRLYYVFSKLVWNRALDVEKLLDETDRIYYGAAAGPMRAYHRLRQEVWDATDGHARANIPARGRLCLDYPGSEEELRKLLDEADRIAAGEADLKARIAIDRAGFEGYWVAPHAAKDLELAERAKLPREAREIDVVWLEGPVDGWPEESRWASAPTRSFAVKGGGAPKEGTSVRMLADGKNWFVRFESECAGEPVAVCDEHDNGKICADDSVEFFAQPEKGEYGQVAVNARGTFLDNRGVGDSDYDFCGEVRVARRDGLIVTDIRFPVEPLAGEGASTRGGWRFRFFRNNPRTREWSSYADCWCDAVPTP